MLCTKSTISQKLNITKIWNLVLHSFQNIVHLLKKYFIPMWPLLRGLRVVKKWVWVLQENKIIAIGFTVEIRKKKDSWCLAYIEHDLLDISWSSLLHYVSLNSNSITFRIAQTRRHLHSMYKQLYYNWIYNF